MCSLGTQGELRVTRREFDQRYPQLSEGNASQRTPKGRDPGQAVRTDVVVHHPVIVGSRLPAAPVDRAKLAQYQVPEDNYFHPYFPSYFAPWDQGNNMNEIYAETCAVADAAAVVEADNVMLKATVEVPRLRQCPHGANATGLCRRSDC